MSRDLRLRPDAKALTSHLGCLPLPVQVFPCSSRYFGATFDPADALFLATLCEAFFDREEWPLAPEAPLLNADRPDFFPEAAFEDSPNSAAVNP